MDSNIIAALINSVAVIIAAIITVNKMKEPKSIEISTKENTFLSWWLILILSIILSILIWNPSGWHMIHIVHHLLSFEDIISNIIGLNSIALFIMIFTIFIWIGITKFIFQSLKFITILLIVFIILTSFYLLSLYGVIASDTTINPSWIDTILITIIIWIILNIFIMLSFKINK